MFPPAAVRCSTPVVRRQESNDYDFPFTKTTVLPQLRIQRIPKLAVLPLAIAAGWIGMVVVLSHQAISSMENRYLSSPILEEEDGRLIPTLLFFI